MFPQGGRDANKQNIVLPWLARPHTIKQTSFFIVCTNQKGILIKGAY